MSTIFSKIIAREIPSDIVYENDSVLAFRDISPQAPVHILVIPKIEIQSVNEIDGNLHAELLGKMFQAAKEIAQKEGLSKDGYRLVINNGTNAGQAVPHLHIHLLGGRKFNWPPG
jgi:histidine triad (HIT) family protein